ncbi:MULTISPECIES: hypothetical protein [Brevundimonas]|jgi:hypothetical protein|uniref:hypothetical protein n=1 Tax=Brevundimonas TaxID=41275 RepID=UPI000F7917C6|nr:MULTISPECIES: hypothetical protein [Brevundimonas]MDM8353846.1 hypothetical protein [Brevundimonas diminuta]
MARRFARSRWFLAFVAMLLSLCVLAPVADAATCAVEFDPSHVVAVVETGDTHQDDAGAAHGACSHGHCHHGVKAPTDVSVETAADFGGLRRLLEPDQTLASVSLDGLKRPPRT